MQETKKEYQNILLIMNISGLYFQCLFDFLTTYQFMAPKILEHENPPQITSV